MHMYYKKIIKRKKLINIDSNFMKKIWIILDLLIIIMNIYVNLWFYIEKCGFLYKRNEIPISIPSTISCT